MDLATSFILYLILFRLAIIGAGVVSIVLGYRLFCRGIWPETAGTSDVSVEAPGGTRMTLKNAAPGTSFALFGVVIITSMLASGSPQLTLNLLRGAQEPGQAGGDAAPAESMEWTIRGGESLQGVTERGREHERAGETDEAVAAYEEAVRMIAEPMNLLAWQYHELGRYEEAVSISRIAVDLVPTDANFLDTLASIESRRGEAAEVP